ncbi:hypothetical protein [Sphingosinicella microcystinivorans]|uniref:hypothetical protein n=1 Tax=Sphingosinicella microcystinivorans TaxID=335406 RepID=UPI0022F3F489|nr:hypothetical protein [Sphingosinicella microcystinivorans]WBX85275.1 hypothetical protein PE061_04965 [Sphingosinicella microcystinivorans]
MRKLYGDLLLLGSGSAGLALFAAPLLFAAPAVAAPPCQPQSESPSAVSAALARAASVNR